MIENIFVLIDKYRQALDSQSALKEALSRANESVEETKKELYDAMETQECTKVSRDGFLYSLAPKTRYRKKGGDEAFFQVLREYGLGDIIKETVNANTLQGAISNLVEEMGELPENFLDVIGVYEQHDIARRKDSSQALKK